MLLFSLFSLTEALGTSETFNFAGVLVIFDYFFISDFSLRITSRGKKTFYFCTILTPSDLTSNEGGIDLALHLLFLSLVKPYWQMQAFP